MYGHVFGGAGPRPAAASQAACTGRAEGAPQRRALPHIAANVVPLEFLHFVHLAMVSTYYVMSVEFVEFVEFCRLSMPSSAIFSLLLSSVIRPPSERPFFGF
jgi:hypothetical protein